MNPRLYATIMLWSASTDAMRHRLETRASASHAYWLDKLNEHDAHWHGSRVEQLRDTLNDLVNHRDEALLYEGRGEVVVGIKPECLPDFRAWCERYGMNAGGL